MKLETFMDRAHNHKIVNDKVAEFIAKEDVHMVELKPYVTDTKYMVVVCYNNTAPVEKKTKKK